MTVKDRISPKWEVSCRFDLKLACEGYVSAECTCDAPCRSIVAGERLILTFAYTARFSNEIMSKEKSPLEKRRARVEEIISQCDITTGNDIVDTMFAFAKLRAAEGLCHTPKGMIHNPGGLSYYAAIWCNDQCEYIAPWFAFTGDKKQEEAIQNIYRWYYPYFNSAYLSIPSSIIACGQRSVGRSR